MLQRIEQLATLSVARGCGFAALGIVTLMFGLSANLAQSMQAGGYLSLAVSLVLLHKARGADRRSYRNTELWILLGPDERPASEVAQRVIGGVLREVYLRFAQRAALIAACLLAGALAYAAIFGRSI